MPCYPPNFKKPDVHSSEILNLNSAVDDGSFKYSPTLRGEMSAQVMPVRSLNFSFKKGIKLGFWKRWHSKISMKKKSRSPMVKESSTVKGKCQSSAATATSKFASKGISAKMRKQILRKYPPAKVKQLHAKLGHIDLRALIKFKRNNKIKALSLPPKLLREYVDDKCPICYTMKRRQPKRPSSLGNAEKCDFKPWQMVYVDTSGKWRVRSSRGNRYHTVFVCAKSGMKLTFPHKKRSHFPLVYMKFVARIGSHPQHLLSDKAGEISSKKFDALLLAKGCNHICLPKNEHYSLGVPEKAIGDLDRNTRAIMADANIPPAYWDIVVQHAALLNACTSPSICAPEMTIFEADTGVVPDLAVFPPPGCFCIRYRTKIDRADHKLDAQNEAGVFLGFGHLDNMFGACILVNKSLVVARNNVAFVESVFPFKEKKSSFTHWESLHKLLGRNNAGQEQHNFDNLLPSESIIEPAAAASPPHQTQPRPSSSPCAYDDNPVDLSSDDEDVENLLEQALEDVQTRSVPSFNPLSESPVRGSNEWPTAGESSLNDVSTGDGGMLDEDTRQTDSADDSIDKPRRSTRKALPIKSSKSVSTKAKDNDKATISKKKSEPIITEKRLQVNRELLLGQKVKRYFTGYGGAVGTVKKYSLKQDAYYLTYADGHHEWIPFLDMLGLLPKSWQKQEANFIQNELFHQVHLAALESQEVCNNPTRPKSPLYTEGHRDIDKAWNAHDGLHWKQASDKEYFTLAEKKKCWKIIKIKDVPRGKSLIDVRWIFKLKYKNGIFEKHRARIVAKGYLQKKDIDYFESFAPTASHITIRLVLAITAVPGFFSYDYDAVCAFISAPLPASERVYMKAIPGYPLKDDECLELYYTIYGLKQSPRAYYLLCKKVYTEIGLTQLKTDECCFMLVKNNVKKGHKIPENFDLNELNEHLTVEIPLSARVYPSCRHAIAILIVVMYVDNNGLRTNAKELVQWFDDSLKAQGEIEMVPEGKFEWFLGVRYTYNLSDGSISADQESTIDRLLQKYGLTNCNPVKVPMRPDTDLAGLPISPISEKTTIKSAYCMLVGELMYIAINTRPEISYSVNQSSRYMTKATKAHYEVLKQILRYLAGVKHLKLTWCAAKSLQKGLKLFQIYSYADTSWADDKDSRKSTCCYLVFVHNAAFSWRSFMSPIVAMSTSEAELIGACACAQEIQFSRKLAAELGFRQHAPTPLFEDNTGCIALAEHGHFAGRSKHIHLRWMFISDYIRDGVLKLHQVPTYQQVADIGTKALPWAAFSVLLYTVLGLA